MPGNTDPLFTKTTKFNGVLINTGNASNQGGGTIGTDIFLLGTVDATNGGLIRRVRFFPTASVAGTATTATVGRVFISSVSGGATTSANTHCVDERVLPSVSASNATTASYFQEFWLPEGLSPGQSILATCHATPAANTAWRAMIWFGDF